MRWASRPLPLPPSDGNLTGREWTALVLGAVALTVLVVVAEPGTFGSFDWVRMHGPYKAYAQSSVANGRMPVWNPHHWLGRPFLADIESAFFYPPEVLYLFLNSYVACALTCALHLLLLLYGMVKLARALGAERLVSLFVAFVFAASAPIVGCFTSGLIHYGQALCLAPLVFYLGVRVQAGPHRRDVALLALLLGLQVLCGHPQAAWLTEVGLIVFLVGRRVERPWLPSLARLGLDLGIVVAALALGLALAAVVLLPLAELVGQSNRSESSVAFAALFSEPLAGWATLLVPTGLPNFGLQANAQLYAGVLPFVAGLCGFAMLRVRSQPASPAAQHRGRVWEGEGGGTHPLPSHLDRDRNIRGLLLLTIFAVLLAAGETTPFFHLLYYTVPGVGWLRIHSRATVLVSFALVLAAGLFFSRPHSRRSLALVAAVTSFAVLAGVVFCLAWPGYGAQATTMAVGRGLAALVAGVLLMFFIVTQQRGAKWAPVLGAMLVLATAVDLLLAMHALKQDNQYAAAVEVERQLQGTLEAEGLLRPGAPPPRVFIPTFRENAGMVRGWSTPHGYSALALGRVWRHLHERLDVEIPSQVTTFPSWALASRGPLPYDSMALVMGEAPDTRFIVRADHPDPRAYVATSIRRVRDDREATALMRAGHDFHGTALVEAPLPLPNQPSASQARATITHFEPERIVLSVDSAAPGLLVLAEPWYPGWSAIVNGASAPVVPANAWMRAVEVPRGKSEVVMTFRSTYLAAGATISLAALALLVGLLLLGHKRVAVRSTS